MNKKILGVLSLTFVIGICIGVVVMATVSKKEANAPAVKPTENTTIESEAIESEQSKKEQQPVEKNTTNQKEFDALSRLSSEFINVYYRVSSETDGEEKKAALLPLISEIGRANLLKDYTYQEGTDMAKTDPVTAKSYVNFDSVSGEAVVMVFMIYQTKYEDNPPVNAQTIVRLQCTKDAQQVWKIDDAEMRLLNQPMPNSYYAT